MADEKLLLDHMLAAYREIVPDHTVNGEFLVRKLAAALYRRGARISIGETIRPPERIIHQSLDADGCLVWVCKQWALVMGYRAHAVVGRPLSDFVTSDSAAFFHDIGMPAVIATGSFSGVFTLITSQGELLPAHGKSEALRDSQGNFERTFGKIWVRVPLLHEMSEGVHFGAR